jgi:hypothetical protein
MSAIANETSKRGRKPKERPEGQPEAQSKDRIQSLADKMVKACTDRVDAAEKVAKDAKDDLEKFMILLRVYLPGTFQSLQHMAPTMSELDRKRLLKIGAIRVTREKGEDAN